jgi:hypothetical protein
MNCSRVLSYRNEVDGPMLFSQLCNPKPLEYTNRAKSTPRKSMGPTSRMQSSRIRYLEIVADENRIVYHQPSSPFVAFSPRVKCTVDTKVDIRRKEEENE